MSVQPSAEFYKKGIHNLAPLQDQPHPDHTARAVSKRSDFLSACDKLGIKPTIRQARDYKRRMGRFTFYKGEQA